jgi:hypothetical protein
MNILKLKSVITSAAALSLMVSAAAFAAGAGPVAGTTGSPSSATPKIAPAKPVAVKPTTTAHTTGQPNQSCGSATAPNTPGHAAAAPGSAFNPDGKSGTVYAGQQPQNSGNPKSVSQYDAACAHQP